MPLGIPGGVTEIFGYSELPENIFESVIDRGKEGAYSDGMVVPAAVR